MAAAQIAISGQSAQRFLSTTDEHERLVMQAVAREYMKILGKLDQNRAIMIANHVGKLFSK